MDRNNFELWNSPHFNQKKDKRKSISPVIRYLIISLAGMTLSILVFYLFKELGY